MNKSTGLILISHGSLLPGAAETLCEHAERIRRYVAYGCVEIAFLNYNEPKLDSAVDSCAARRVDRIVIVPYFLVAGKFVSTDLLRAVSGVRSLVPNVPIDIAEPIGYDELLAGAIFNLAAIAKNTSRRSSSSMKSALLIMAHGSPNPDANKDIYRVAEDLRTNRIYDPLEVCF